MKLAPNGTVSVVMEFNYGNNLAGETCGFSPHIAEKLVKDGTASYSNQSVVEKVVEAVSPSKSTGRGRG